MTDEQIVLALMDATAPIFNTTLAEMKIKQRYQNVVDARYCVFAFLKQKKDWGPVRTVNALPLKMDHSTIINGTKSSCQIAGVDPAYNERRELAFSAMGAVYKESECEPTPPLDQIFLTTNEA